MTSRGMQVSAGLAAATLGLAFAMAGCDDEVVDPVDSGSGGLGGSGGSAPGGAGGEYLPSRGDPADFPGTCSASCGEACERLESCDGASSSIYPLGYDDCMVRCGLAQNGPVWDDVSQNFLCCTAQASCQQVQHCGGWLDHPDALESCDKVCTCFFGAALEEMAGGREAPAGYRYACDVLMMEMGELSTDPASVPAATLSRSGRFAEVRMGAGAGPATLAALARLGRVLPTFHDGDGRLAAATGRVVVRARTETARLRSAEVAGRFTDKALRDLGLGDGLWLIEVPDPWRALDALAALRAVGLEVELDMVRQYDKRYLPDDPLFGAQWHLLNQGQGASTLSVDARVSEAWDVTLGDPQVIVAVNDDGVDLNHADFAGKLEPELNYPGDWQSLMAMGNFAGHGTSVAGVATALADDTLGGSGVCPGCRLLPHRLGESTFISFQVTDVEIADGFKNQVDAGAAVINNSWGPGLGDPTYVDATFPAPAVPMVVADALQYAEDTGRGGLGTVIVFAAGNSNTVTDKLAGHPLTVAVAAVGDTGLKSYYSSYGSATSPVTVAAPSNGALTGITTSAAGGGHTDSFGGTSSASPLVAGLVGLILSANPALTAAQVRTLLQDSATAIDPVWGQWDAGRSIYYGAGLVNAWIAVQMATGACVDAASCPAPSDDCGPGCGSGVACGVCRTQADCAPGFACQALPSLGELVCVAEEGSGCAAGTTAVNGYCLPDRQSCGLCGGLEECNGADDNCDGQADEADVCEGAGARCFVDGVGCDAGQVCAGTRCVPECTDDAGCGEGFQCKPVKDQYGAYDDAVRGCVQDQLGQCQLGCSVLVSSVDDATLQQFVECMQDGQAGCSEAFGCVQLLPITL